jgi:hypothetical protein
MTEPEIDQHQNHTMKPIITDQLEMAADRMRQVVRQQRTASGLDGPPGVGKSFLLDDVCKEEGCKATPLSTTAGGLIQNAFRYRDVRVVAFEDFDSCLRNEAMANFVKQMIGTNVLKLEPRRVTHQTVTAINNQNRKSGPLEHIAPPIFWVRFGVVMTTNLPLANPEAIHVDMREHVEALKDRGLEFLHISRDVHDIAEYVISLSERPGMLEFWKINLDKRAITEVKDFFVENLQRMETVSIRRFQSICLDRMTMPDRWRKLQMATFKPDPVQPAMKARERATVKRDIERMLKLKQNQEPRSPKLTQADKSNMLQALKKHMANKKG